MPQTKLIAIAGPTASGKSDLAVYLAKKFNGAIISADSRQVYLGLDLGTGKITKTEQQNIDHYLLDVARPTETFTVTDFKKLAKQALLQIKEKNQLPIITGGTGFYLDTFIYDLNLPIVPPNLNLRAELQTWSLAKLQAKLEKLDPARFSNIDLNNRPRLIRAIEISKTLGKVPILENHRQSPYDVLYLALEVPQPDLDKKIYNRLLKRLDEGLIEEVKNLEQTGLTWSKLEAFGLEYRYISLFLQNKLTKAEMIDKLYLAIRQYSRRQLTWFKKNKNIIWLPLNESRDQAEKLITKFLKT